jgi:type I restriction enzyme S subunit
VQSALCQLVTGTSNSHQRVKPDNVLELPIVCPPPPVIASFTDHVVPLLDRFLANREETISLANLRDTLLPRLMSGKLRIPDVEEVLA